MFYWKRVGLWGVLLWYSLLFSYKKPSLLILDSTGKEFYNYRNISLLAQSAGFNVFFKTIFDLLEDNSINNFDAILCMPTISMLMIKNEKYPLGKKTFCHPSNLDINKYYAQAIKTFSSYSNKNIIFLLPSFYSKNNKKLQIIHKGIIDFLNKCIHFKKIANNLKETVHNFLQHLSIIDSNFSALFATALVTKEGTIIPSTFNLPQSSYIKTPSYSLNSLLQPLLPQSLLIHNKALGNTYLISSISHYCFSDIGEFLFKNPHTISDRNLLLNVTLQDLLAFRLAVENKKLYTKLPVLKLPSLFNTKTLHQMKKTIAKKQKNKISPSYQWLFQKNGSCAWLDPYDFFGHEDNLQILQKIKNSEIVTLDRGIQIIYDANFDLLWFECLPEWYLSPHGLRARNKEEYIARLKKLFEQIKLSFVQKDKKLPKIFIGLNLTSNFKSYPVAHAVCNIFGKVYSKIPSPFDFKHFWKPEVLDVFKEFVSYFKEDIPIDGVFFDFEMYHAPEQTSAYTDLMDFSDFSWKIYCKTHYDKNAYKCKTINERIQYLQKHFLFRDFFKKQEKFAQALGKKLKYEMQKIIPGLLFGAYTPTLPSSWFYRGMMAGLSTPNQPLILATFNIDYISHYLWLLKNKINLLHGTAIMLSKLQKKADFSIISSSLGHHDFTWYNRPSRMIYQYDKNQLAKNWWALEASPLDTHEMMRFIRLNHHKTIPCRSKINL